MRLHSPPPQAVRLGFAAAIGVLIFLPIFFSKGAALYIGCDTLLPFTSAGLRKYLFQWLDIQDGSYWVLSSYPQYLYYKVFEFFTDNIYTKASILHALMNAFSAWGAFRLVKALDKGAPPIAYFLAVSFYLLSPARYNAWVYLQIYAVIPWFLYATLRVIEKRRIEPGHLLIFTATLFAGSLDLPNPKYIFYLFVMGGVSLAVAWVFREIDASFFRRNAARALLLALQSTYLALPLVYFVLHYDPGQYGGVAVRSGYTHDTSAKMMDFGSATAEKMIRLFQDGLTFIPSARPLFLSNPFTIVAGIFFFGLIIFYFIRKPKAGFHDLLLLVLSLVFLFFAMGPNPPFGFVYEFFVTRFSVLAFLRTTAGAVFYLSLFYTLLLFRALCFFKSRALHVTFAVALAAIAYPQLTGIHFRNWSPVNPYIDKDTYGIKVPQEYFSIKPLLDGKRLVARTFIPHSSDLSYINTSWGFFGPGAFYHYLYNGYFIGERALKTDPIRYAIKYILWDRSLISGGQDSSRSWWGKTDVVARTGFLRVDSVKDEFFSPMIQAVSGVGAPPTVEFRRTDPARYRVVLHGVREDVTLVLSEKFHPLWRIYLVDRSGGRTDLPIDSYKTLAYNEREQADIAELKEFLSKSWITSLRRPESNHAEGGIDFISKRFSGTIQNDNLAGVGHFETLRYSALPAEHQSANAYANSWLLRWDELVEKFPERIVRRKDGGLDVELIVEFFPQRIFDLSAAVSLAAILSGCALALRRKNSKVAVLEIASSERTRA